MAFARADADNSGTYTAYGTDAPAGSIAASSKELSFAPAQYYRANGNKTKLIRLVSATYRSILYTGDRRGGFRHD